MSDWEDLIGGGETAPEDRGDGGVYRVTSEELRQFIERVEMIEGDIKASQDERTEVYAEAKGRGYDTKVMKKIVRIRKIAAEALAEEESVESLYREALGLPEMGGY